MRNWYIAALFVVILLIFSCEDSAFMVNCSECLSEEPTDAELYIDLDPDHFYNALVEIWEGSPADSIRYGSYISYSRVLKEFVRLNTTYTLTARYIVDGETYVAVDESTPRVRYDKSQCDEACYYIYDRKCNLKLKLN